MGPRGGTQRRGRTPTSLAEAVEPRRLREALPCLSNDMVPQSQGGRNLIGSMVTLEGKSQDVTLPRLGATAGPCPAPLCLTKAPLPSRGMGRSCHTSESHCEALTGLNRPVSASKKQGADLPFLCERRWALPRVCVCLAEAAHRVHSQGRGRPRSAAACLSEALRGLDGSHSGLTESYRGTTRL